jgi:predicted RNase H-like HicB family nuclease
MWSAYWSAAPSSTLVGIQKASAMAASEYDSYASTIVGMLCRDCSAHDLEYHLARLETDSMGLGARPSSSRTAVVADAVREDRLGTQRQRARRRPGLTRLEQAVDTCHTAAVTLTIELEQETDGRWIAEVPQLPGVLVYGDSAERAAQMARALAFRVLADQIEAGEVDASLVNSVSFAA